MIVWKWIRNNRNSEIGTLSQWKELDASIRKVWYVSESRYSFKSTIDIYIYIIGGGFIYFFFHPDPGGMIQFD